MHGGHCHRLERHHHNGRDFARIGSAAPSPFTGTVLNIAGREVATLTGTLDPTTRRAVLMWPYVSRHGTRVPPGPYIVVVRAAAPTGEICQQAVQVHVRPR